MTGFRGFVTVWSGQLASLTGSALSGFALSVYVYRQTGSVAVLGFVYALAFLPTILASPFTGSLVDRWGVRKSLLVSNLGSLLVMTTLAGLLATDMFVPWHIYPVVIANSGFRALQTPAFAAAVPLLVPARHLGRANGMTTLALATSQVAAPVAAGALLLVVDVAGVILLDCVSFGAALLTLLVVRIPRPAGPDGPVEPSAAGVLGLLRDFQFTWRHVAQRPGLLALLLFIAALNFGAGFVDILIMPMVLAFAQPDGLGTVLTVGGLGMIVGSVALTAWGGPRRRVRGLLGAALVIAAATVLGAVRPNLVLVAAAAALFLGALAVVIGVNQSIWQSKVEPALMGRAMALQNMVANAPQLVAYALAGLAADDVFEPLVGREHVGSATVAALVGNGPGRGIALLLMVVGGLIAVAVAVAAGTPRLRRLEDELPDVAPDGRPATEPAVVR